MPRTPQAAVVIAALLALGACAASTPYQAAGVADAQASGGYREAPISPDRWRVTFKGNDLTSRETVETYLLYRSAELTVERGYDWFQNVQSRTEAHTDTFIYRRPEPVFADAYWGPHWRYRRHGWYADWHSWDPWGPNPFFDTGTVTAYEAVAEIVMGHGAKPADDRTAFDARAVMQTLGPRIARPR